MTTLSSGEILIMVVFIGSAGTLFLLILIFELLRRFIIKRKHQKIKRKGETRKEIDLTSDRITYFGNILEKEMNKKETMTWICKSKNCISWRDFGNFCKIEVKCAMTPHICPFMSCEKSKWEAIGKE